MQIHQQTHRQPFNALCLLCGSGSVAKWVVATLRHWHGETVVVEYVQWLNRPCWWRQTWEKAKTVLPKSKTKGTNMCDDPCMCMYCICMCACVCMQDPAVCVRAVGGSCQAYSVSATGRGAGLVEAHDFTQPPSEVHLLHFWSLDECVALENNVRQKSIFSKHYWKRTQN